MDLTAIATVRRGFDTPAPPDVVPVLPALRPLLPDAGLTPGSVVAVDGSAFLGPALLAGPLHEHDWTAIVGVPEAGLQALAGMGADLQRVLLVDQPRTRWAEVTGELVRACRIVLVGPA
ncbi:MAG: hypothetical protein ACJ72W_03180, partial [Actinoallomurus sp.]